jgi:hypothetical protein
MHAWLGVGCWPRSARPAIAPSRRHPELPDDSRGVVAESSGRALGDQVLAVQPDQQRHAPLDRSQASVAAGGDKGAGQVDQFAALPPGAGGDHHDPAGPQQGGASGEDLGDAVGQGVEAVLGEVDRVADRPAVLVPSGTRSVPAKGGAGWDPPPPHPRSRRRLSPAASGFTGSTRTRPAAPPSRRARRQKALQLSHDAGQVATGPIAISRGLSL